MATVKRVELTDKKTNQKVEMDLDRYNSLTSKQRDQWVRGRTLNKYLPDPQKKTGSESQTPQDQSLNHPAQPVDEAVAELQDELKEAKARVLDLETQLAQREGALVNAATVAGIEVGEDGPDLDTLGGRVAQAIDQLTQEAKGASETRDILDSQYQEVIDKTNEQLMRIATATKTKTKAKEAGNDIVKIATLIADSFPEDE